MLAGLVVAAGLAGQSQGPDSTGSIHGTMLDKAGRPVTGSVFLIGRETEMARADSTRIISPISAGQLLTIFSAAARDSTAMAFVATLGLGRLDPSEVACRSTRLNRAIHRRTDVDLSIGNAGWVDPQASLKIELARLLRASYGATNDRLHGIRRRPAARAMTLPLGDTLIAYTAIRRWRR